MKNRFRQFCGISIISILAFSLASCGRIKTGEDITEEADTDFVYTAEYHALDSGVSLSGICSDGKNFYYSIHEYDEEAEKSLNFIYRIDTCADAGKGSIPSLVVTTPVVTEENGNTLYRFLSDMEVIPSASGSSLVCLEAVSEIINTETYETKESWALSVIDAEDGSLLSKRDLTGISGLPDTRSSPHFLEADREGNIYLAWEKQILVFTKELEPFFSVPAPADAQIWSMGAGKDGLVYYASLSVSTQGIELNRLNPVKKDTDKTCRENILSLNGCGIAPGLQKGVLLSGSLGIVEYDPDSQSKTPVLDWTFLEIPVDFIRFYTPLEDGRILVLTEDLTSEFPQYELIYLTKTPSCEVTEKEVITLGLMKSDSELNHYLVDFNKRNSQYRIRVMEYDTGDREKDITRFYNDITAGNGADIFNLQDLDRKVLAEKGLLEDLNSYLENDPELEKKDYFSSVLDAYTIDGKLYSIPGCFSIDTVIGKTLDVGSRPGWALKDLISLAESKSESTQLFCYYTKNTVLLSTLVRYNLASFIDRTTGECHFDSENFIQVLEFADRFGQKEYQPEESTSDTVTKIRNGQLLLLETGISSVQDYQMCAAMFDEPITFIGYPSTDGTGSVIRSQISLAVNSKSQKKEGAWQFIRSFLTPEAYEKSAVSSFGFPTLISAYDKQNEAYMKPEYYTDENGEQIELSKGRLSLNDFSIDLYAATQEDIHKITDLISGCNKSYEYDEQLLKIITEEAQPYFEGQKTAQEAACIIQNRAQIYVSENL